MATCIGYLVLVVSVFLTSKSLAKPVEEQALQGLTIDEEIVDGPSRSQRSPQFGFENEYDEDYEGPQGRHLKHKHKPKPHKPQGGHGCRTNYGCGVEWQQPHEGHQEVSNGGHGGSFASASAGSLGGDHHGTHSEANAHSASFSFGPYTATFSAAQAHSGAGGGQGGQGGQGGFGGFDY